MDWTVEAALAELRALTEETRRLEQSNEAARSAAHVLWRMRVEAALEEVLGADSRYAKQFGAIRFSGPNTYLYGGRTPAYPVEMEEARGVLGAAVMELERRAAASGRASKDIATGASEVTRLIALAQRKLRKQFHSPPEDEKEVQDRYAGLLDGADIPYQREQVYITFSSKQFKPDFTVEPAGLAIEVKLVRKPDDERRVIEEMAADLPAYQTRIVG